MGTKYVVAALAACMTLASGAAMAKGKVCNLTGTWTDSLGSQITFTSNKSGTLYNPSFCANTYKLGVLDTQTQISFQGKSKKPYNCSLEGLFTPNYPSCTSAYGLVNFVGSSQYNDTITKVSGAKVRHPDTSALVRPLR